MLMSILPEEKKLQTCLGHAHMSKVDGCLSVSEDTSLNTEEKMQPTLSIKEGSDCTMTKTFAVHLIHN